MAVNRIVYDKKAIDVPVAVGSLRLSHMHERKQNRSASGKTETINLYGIQEVEFDGIFNEQTYRDLIGWWSWARQGKSWSFEMQGSSNIVQNPNFDDTKIWVSAGGTSNLISSGLAHIHTTGNGYFRQSHGFTTGATYTALLSVVTITSGGFTLYTGNLAGSARTTALGRKSYSQVHVGDEYFHLHSGGKADIKIDECYAFKSPGNTIVDSSVGSGQNVIPLTTTNNFSIGDKCLIRDAQSDDEYEIVEITDITTGVSVTIKYPLSLSYSTDSIFRHWRYWPDVVSINNNFQPAKTPGVDQYRHKFRLAENL